MSVLNIYVPQNPELLKESLDAIVSLMGSETFKSAVDIMLIASGITAIFQYVKGAKIKAITSYILTTYLCIFCLFGIKSKVAIFDLQNMESTDSALSVDNVPLGVALPASFVSRMGAGITQLFGDTFHMPNDMEYNKSGLIFGARAWISASSASLSMSPEFSQDLSSYIRQCVFSAKLLASRSMKATDLKESTLLKGLLFNNASPVYRVIFHDGENHSCGAAAELLKKELPGAAEKEISKLSALLTKGDSKKYKESLSAANLYFMDTSKDSAEILTQNILINEVRNAQADAFAFSGADAHMMNYTNSSSLQKMHVAQANSFWLTSYQLPGHMAALWILTICIFPLVLLLSLIPSMTNVFKLYVQSQVYLWSWPPMFIIIHFMVSFMASKSINIFSVHSGGISFSSLDPVVSMHSSFAYTAGALASSVPFLAFYITKGLSSVLSSSAQHFGGLAQSISSSEAQSIAQGNISMASYSGWNMNYDNMNAHKHDTNQVEAHGRSTVQLDNGAQVSKNADGSTTTNVHGAISNSAVDIHGAERVADSMQQGANKFFNSSEQNRIAADQNMQAGLSGVKNFTDSTSNDSRSGAGISMSTDDSYSNDIRTMRDSVNGYNEHLSKSGGWNSDQVLSAKMDSADQIFGRLGKVATGASASISGSVRHSSSGDKGLQDFNNSSEGKAYNEAYSHLVRTAKSNHLDASNGKNLTGSEQIAYNLYQGHSLGEQSASEYSQGQQLSNNASHIRENSTSINSNLNQSFHDYVARTHPEDGASVMTGVTGKDIEQQNIWANEFINSSSGQNAISSQVSSQLSTSPQNLINKHNSTVNSMKQGFSGHKAEHQSNYNSQLQTKQTETSFTQMNSSQLEKANRLRSDNIDLDLKKGALANRTRDQLNEGSQQINSDLNKNKGKFNEG